MEEKASQQVKASLQASHLFAEVEASLQASHLVAEVKASLQASHLGAEEGQVSLHVSPSLVLAAPMGLVVEKAAGLVGLPRLLLVRQPLGLQGFALHPLLARPCLCQSRPCPWPNLPGHPGPKAGGGGASATFRALPLAHPRACGTSCTRCCHKACGANSMSCGIESKSFREPRIRIYKKYII